LFTYSVIHVVGPTISNGLRAKPDFDPIVFLFNKNSLLYFSTNRFFRRQSKCNHHRLVKLMYTSRFILFCTFPAQFIATRCYRYWRHWQAADIWHGAGLRRL